MSAERWAAQLPRWTAAGLTLAVAESCTGGLLAAALTDVAGASAVFLGAIIAYSNAAKEALLGVPHALIVRHGAVSAEVARAMAANCRARFHSDVALSITGIAGPAGGTAAKPVGLTFIGLATDEGTSCRRFQWAEDRAGNRKRAVDAALALLDEAIRRGRR
jgi:PncC family amidohydrolase